MAYAPLGSPSYSAHPREDKERPRTRAKTLRLVRAPVYEDSDTESVDLDLPSDPVSPSTVSSSAKPRARSKSSTKASTHRKSVAKEVTPVLEAPSPESEEVDELVDEGVVEPEERVASPPEVSPSPPPRRLRRLVRRASTTEVPETPAPEDPEVASPEALPEAALLAAAPEAQSRGGSASEAEGEMEGRQEDEDVVMGNMEMAGEDLSADEALALDLQREELERAEHALSELGLEAELEVALGPPAERIVALAERRHADLIVVGTREPDLLERLFGLSVSDAVEHRAHCDVLIVH